MAIFSEENDLALNGNEGFLNQRLCSELREMINSSPIFSHDPKYLGKYNLCCAVMDRLDTCVEYLNKHNEYPDSEVDFLVFMMFACMTIDAVREILSELGVHDKKAPVYNSEADYMFFKDIYTKSRIYNPDADVPNDDKFFEYLRSLTFAHPFETSHPKFLKKNEKQYSPWVIANRLGAVLPECPDPVGVRIYTNQEEDIIDLTIPFSRLKDYIKSRYDRLKSATGWAQGEVEQAIDNWKKTKVDRNKTPLDMLVEEVFDRLFMYPTKMHTMARYQLEKIFTSDDVRWASCQTDAFAAEFAKKWVTIKAYDMPWDEINLLVRTACYLERCEQEANT